MKFLIVSKNHLRLIAEKDKNDFDVIFNQNVSIALIGNANGIIDPYSTIDNFDLVIRLNHGYLIPKDGSRGHRTDVVCTSSIDCLRDFTAGSSISKLCVWMTPKGREEVVKSELNNVYFYAIERWDQLFKKSAHVHLLG